MQSIPKSNRSITCESFFIPPTTLIKFLLSITLINFVIHLEEILGPKPSPNWKFSIPNSRHISMAFSKSFSSNFELLITILTGNFVELTLSISFAKASELFLERLKKLGVYSIPPAPESIAKDKNSSIKSNGKSANGKENFFFLK